MEAFPTGNRDLSFLSTRKTGKDGGGRVNKEKVRKDTGSGKGTKQ